MGISGVVLTCGEERRILTCLRNLAQYVNEIVILDGGNDKTGEIAAQFGARVYKLPQGERVGEYGSDGRGANWHEPYRREILLGLCRHDWCLIMDADELLDAPADAFRHPEPLAFPRYNLITPNEYISFNGQQ